MTASQRPRAVLMNPEEPGDFVRAATPVYDMTGIAGVHGGLLYLGGRDGDRCAVGRYDPTTLTSTWMVTRLCVRDLTMAGDRTLLGVAAARAEGRRRGATTKSWSSIPAPAP